MFISIISKFLESFRKIQRIKSYVAKGVIFGHFGAFWGFFDPFWAPGDAIRVFSKIEKYYSSSKMKLYLHVKFQKILMSGSFSKLRTNERTNGRTNGSEFVGPFPSFVGGPIRIKLKGTKGSNANSERHMGGEDLCIRPVSRPCAMPKHLKQNWKNRCYKIVASQFFWYPHYLHYKLHVVTSR